MFHHNEISNNFNPNVVITDYTNKVDDINGNFYTTPNDIIITEDEYKTKTKNEAKSFQELVLDTFSTFAIIDSVTSTVTFLIVCFVIYQIIKMIISACIRQKTKIITITSSLQHKENLETTIKEPEPNPTSLFPKLEEFTSQKAEEKQQN